VVKVISVDASECAAGVEYDTTSIADLKTS